MSIISLFPFDSVPQNSKIILYGAGGCGRNYWNQNAIVGWCNIRKVVDKNYLKIKDFPIKIYSPNIILRENEFDFIVIAIEDEITRLEALNYLLSMGIYKEKIISKQDTYIFKDDFKNINLLKDNKIYKEKIRVGYCISEAIGDQIISLKLYQEIIKLSKEAEIDIFCTTENITKAIYWNQKQLGKIYNYYPDEKEMSNYDIFLYAEFIPLLKVYRRKKIKKIAYELYDALERLYNYQMTCSPDNAIPVYRSRIILDRARFYCKNRYTMLGCDGVFDIRDSRVEINMNTNYLNDFEKLNLKKNFITIHYGASNVMHNGKQQTKIWPLEYYNKLNILIKKMWPELQIIQLGGNDDPQLVNVDLYMQGKSLEIVKYILKNALLHFDCDSGLVHLATQLMTKCFVVFGPTPIWFFGYPQNVNIAPMVCGECKGLVKDWYVHCIKYDRPECMYSIQPQYIIDLLENFITKNLKP